MDDLEITILIFIRDYSISLVMLVILESLLDNFSLFKLLQNGNSEIQKLICISIQLQVKPLSYQSYQLHVVCKRYHFIKIKVKISER